ncbi:hypothetical protein B0H14DRAFT_3865899, partial [Mycena olivaceomarginata]
MGLADAENKRVWLTCRKSVRNNLTRAGFDHDVDFASQEKLKVANCLAAIEHECPLFKRFKGSWVPNMSSGRSGRIGTSGPTRPMRNSPIPRPTTMLTTTKIVMKTQGIQMRKRAGGSASRTKTKT